MENGKTHLWHSSFLYTLFSFSFWKQLPRWRCIKFGNNQYYSRSRCFKYITKWNFPSVYFMKTKFLYQIHCDILYSIKIAFHLLNTEFLDRTTEIIYKIYSVYQYIVYGIQIQCNANKIHWLLRSFFLADWHSLQSQWWKVHINQFWFKQNWNIVLSVCIKVLENICFLVTCCERGSRNKKSK